MASSIRKSINILAASAVLASLSAVSAYAQQVLRINSFGGVYEETHQRLVIKPFEEANNVKVEVVTLYSADTLAQLRAQKDAPQFDVVHFSGGQEIVAAREGLLIPIKKDELTNYDALYPFATANIEQGIGPAYVVVANGLIVNTEKLENAPTSWAEFLSGDYGDGVTLTDLSNTYGLQALLMMNQVAGGTLENIQPGLDAARKLLDAGAQVVASAPEIQQSFAQGASTIAPYAQEYAYTLRAAGLPVAFVAPSDGAPVSYFTISAVAGRENSELAKKFIDFSLSAEVQAGWAEAMRYSPTNKEAKLADDVAKDVIYGEQAMSQTVRFDPEVINANRPAWVEAWNRTIAQ